MTALIAYAVFALAIWWLEDREGTAAGKERSSFLCRNCGYVEFRAMESNQE